MPAAAGTGLSRRMVDLRALLDEEQGDRSSEYVDKICGYLRGYVYRLADLERALQFSRQKAKYYPEYDSWDMEKLYGAFMGQRAGLLELYSWPTSRVARKWIGDRCGAEWLEHQPTGLWSLGTAYAAPYLFTYYMDRF